MFPVQIQQYHLPTNSAQQLTQISLPWPNHRQTPSTLIMQTKQRQIMGWAAVDKLRTTIFAMNGEGFERVVVVGSVVNSRATSKGFNKLVTHTMDMKGRTIGRFRLTAFGDTHSPLCRLLAKAFHSSLDFSSTAATVPRQTIKCQSLYPFI